ncbi:hypothetical protein OOT46_22985 [Aquabacterium sp. A7-Y]|uniref:hypothetical protein n=1 Tax=Aquabacterium sp. A7-Y TaxID=1349605 RepID=UPI00223DC668|nr:hypothetical protein [Aquabacterium sp. A7-Y]MCW7540688.1 hypothetical protein [Aquabacterium sp. A7-Y]
MHSVAMANRLRDTKVLHVLLAAMLAALAAGAQAQGDPWAGVTVPKGWSLVKVGEQVRVSGLPMTLRAGVVSTSLAASSEALRQTWGELVQVQMAPEVALVSKKFGPHFVTAQLTPGNDGRSTRVVLSSVRLQDLVSGPVPRPFARMPPGSHLVYDTESLDRGKSARHVSWVNGLSLQSNRNFVVRGLEQDGFVLQADETTPQGSVPGRLLLLSAPGREATVVLRQTQETTSVTVNTTTHAEALR